MKESLKYIGLAFKDGGRDAKGLDCWGLVTLYYQNELGVILPDVGVSAYDQEAIGLNYKQIAANWVQVDEPQPNCLCTFRNHLKFPDITNHVGVYVGDGKFLHILELGSVLGKLIDWNKRLSGFFVWAGK